MNLFPAGSHVFFHDSTGRVVKGVVESTSRMGNGMQIIVIRCDNGGQITLPASSVFTGSL
ncbi:hypothetical protein DFS33DRAFT_1346512 [Desarmillaria ectypa]|nr:hypothetical protein DFS33DRAFT_1346512 [Desarmillaria ectypa]